MTDPRRNETPAAATPRAAAGRDGGPPAQAAGPLVVYCGGCNPHIDRGAVAREVEEAAPPLRPGAALYLSGCPRACASGHRLAFAREDGGPASAGGAAEGNAPAVVVAGTLVDGDPTAPPDIAAAIIDKLKE